MMPIGTVRLGSGAKQYSTPSLVQNSFGEGVGLALKGLNAAVEDKNAAANAEVERREDLDAQLAWTTTQGQWAREQQDTVANSPASGTGLTEGRVAALRTQRDEFIATLPERLRPQYMAETETKLQNFATQTYAEEYQIRSTYETDSLGKLAGFLGGEIQQGRTTQEEALVQFGSALDKTNLPEATKIAMREAAQADLGMAQFNQEMIAAQQENAPVGPADGSDVVAPGLLPWERGFLRATGADEAKNYNVIYGGQTFSDFSWHPGIYVTITEGPHKGEKSSAAGQYQFLESTWNEVVSEMNAQGANITDFSPVNQDRAALYLARRNFNRQIGPGEWDFDRIMAEGNDAQIAAVKKALAPTWDAFRTMSDERFVALFRSNSDRGTGTAQAPDPWNDPRYSALPTDVKNQMAAQAAAAQRQMQTELASQRADFTSALQTQIQLGQAGMREVSAAFEAGQIDIGSIPTLTGMAQKADEERKQGGVYGTQLSSGNTVADTSENRKAASTFYRDNGVTTGIAAQDPRALSRLASDFAKGGIIPTEITDQLLSMARSNSPQGTKFAMDAMTALKQRSPETFAFAVGKDLTELQTAWEVAQRYSPNGDVNAAIQRFNDFRDPTKNAERAKLREQAREELAGISPEQIMREFAGGSIAQGVNAVAGEGAIEMPTHPGVAAKFKSDFDFLYEKYYPLYGDAEATTEFVVQEMQHNWAPDATGGENRLMYLGPSSGRSGYSPHNGSYDWVRQDILTSQRWDLDTQFSLLTDAQTEAEIASGVPGSYQIAKLNEDGQWEMVMDATGAATRFRPTYTAEAQETDLQTNMAIQTEERVDALRLELFNVIEENTAPNVPRPAGEVFSFDNLTGSLRTTNPPDEKYLPGGAEKIAAAEKELQEAINAENESIRGLNVAAAKEKLIRVRAQLSVETNPGRREAYRERIAILERQIKSGHDVTSLELLENSVKNVSDSVVSGLKDIGLIDRPDVVASPLDYQPDFDEFTRLVQRQNSKVLPFANLEEVLTARQEGKVKSGDLVLVDNKIMMVN